MAFFYNFGIYVYTLGLHIAALFYPKAQLWVAGRRDWRARYRAEFQKKSRVLWVHAASLGEFEQGRPVIEAWRAQFPDWQIVLTFFSPSGYELRRHYPQADFVAYLPADTRNNATDFLDIIQPDAVVFVKYEFWFNYLGSLQRRSTPTLLVSALFREQQAFFQPWGGFWRRGLAAFTHFFVQNEASATLLQSIGFQNVTVAGDTRIDRVLQIAAAAPGNALVAEFVAGSSSSPLAPPSPPVKGGSGIEENKTTHALSIENSAEAGVAETYIPFSAKPSERASPPFTGGLGGAYSTASEAPIFIAGSSWEADEAVFGSVFFSGQTTESRQTAGWKVIVAPHEPSEKNVQRLLRHPKAIRYSQATAESLYEARLLVIDNVGMLNTLYRYGTVAYIGGGFGVGIHNTLEPAAFGLPIIFGPKYTKFEEARAFVARGAAFVVQDAAELSAVLQRLEDPDFYQQTAQAAKDFLEENRGATQRVVAFLEQLVAGA